MLLKINGTPPGLSALIARHKREDAPGNCASIFRSIIYHEGIRSEDLARDNQPLLILPKPWSGRSCRGKPLKYYTTLNINPNSVH